MALVVRGVAVLIAWSPPASAARALAGFIMESGC
jgi:hypothetical protein